MNRTLGNVKEKDDSAFDDESVTNSNKSSKNEKSLHFDHNNSNYDYERDRDSQIDDPNMQSLSYNTANIEDKVSKMENFYKYSKLKGNVRNIPLHKFMSLMENETKEVKELLQEGKKQRRILQGKFCQTENDVILTCDNLIMKGFNHIDQFRQDMLKIIQKNNSDTQKIIKEAEVLEQEINKSKKDIFNLNTMLKDAEHDLGVLNYTKEVN